LDPHANPYAPGAGVKPPALVARDQELDDFSVALARLSNGSPARSFILDGLRGVGKTVLLEEFDIAAREKGWITSGVVECNEDDALVPVIAKVAHRALRKLSRGRRMSSQVRQALGVLKAFAFTMDEGGTWRFNVDVDAVRGVADSGDPEVDIVELFGEVGKAAATQGAGALFILDEMQFLSRGDLGLLATVCHHLSQETHPVLIAGAGLPQLPLMLKEAKPYTERLFNYKTIENLRRPEAARALTLPAKRAGVAYQDAALELILDRSAGYPFFLQQWGETVWAEAEGDSEITLDDAQAAEEVVDDELERRFFRDRYEKATDAEKIYMAALADLGDGQHTSAEIADHLGTTQRAVSVRRANLLQKGLIYNPVDTKLDFTVPHFAAYMRRVHPFDRAERPRRGRPPKGNRIQS
jgi:hypothetical protein